MDWNMDWESQVKTGSMLSFLFAVWLFVSPYVLGTSGFIAGFSWWTLDAAAIGVGVLSIIRFLRPQDTEAMSWINALAGLWLIASPFVWSLTGDFYMLWDFLIVGLAFVVLNVWAALARRVFARA